jgi:hypothetical protein
MQAKVINVLKPFLTFASSFQRCHVHNMLVLNIDLHFMNLERIRDYADLELAMHVAKDYDRKILIPLLLIVYHASTPNSTTIRTITSTVVELGVFRSLTSTEEVVMGFIQAKLSPFKRTIMPINPLSSFAWWAKHEQ